MKKLPLIILLIIDFTYSYCQFPDYQIQNDSIINYLGKHHDEWINARFNCLTEDKHPELSYCSDWNGDFVIKTDSNKIVSTYKIGRIKEESQVTNGKLNGITKMYYFDTGLIFSEIEYKNGLIWNAKFYNKVGALLTQGSFKDGTGLLKYYRQSGSICMISNYKNGILDGKLQYLYSNGKIMVSGQCVTGQMKGTWSEYNINGLEVKKTVY